MEENIIEEVIQDVEHVFTPRPGGMIDRHNQDKARREAAQRQREQANERIEESSYKSVKTAQISPEIFSAQTLTIPAGGNAVILPKSDYRYRATIMVVTAASSITLAKDSGAAISGNGFQLPTGIPVTTYTRGQVIAGNTSASPIQVTVMTDIYAPEERKHG